MPASFVAVCDRGRSSDLETELDEDCSMLDEILDSTESGAEKVFRIRSASDGGRLTRNLQKRAQASRAKRAYNKSTEPAPVKHIATPFPPR